MKFPILLPILLIVAVASVHAAPPPEVVALQRTMHQVIEVAEPSIACILVSRSDKYTQLGEGPSTSLPGKLGGFTPIRHRRFLDPTSKDFISGLDLAAPQTVPEAYGSGIVIDPTGLILTNFHVVDRATKVYVRLPGEARGSYADIVAGDGRCDLAVLRMQSPPSDLKAIPFGAGERSRKGDWVVSLANPFAAGFRDGSPSAGTGIISNLRRRGPGSGEEARNVRPFAQHAWLLQTDVRLNLGCSGGALLNLEGQLIGMTTSLAALSGGEAAGGYAIPIDNNVKKMIDILKRGEEVEYGFLGVSVFTDERPNVGGVVVRETPLGQPAFRAGMRRGDIITAINGHSVRDQDDLFLNIGAALAGTEAQIDLNRNGRPLQVRARLVKSGHSEKVIASQRPRPIFGLTVDYASTLSREGDIPDGVVVKAIEGGSPAERKLKAWSEKSPLIITAVNGKEVALPAEFYREAAGKASVVLEVIDLSREAPSRQKVTLP
jgi:serine protease Do